MVPNGGRVYYSRRSQPPLLTQMVAIYYNATGNDSFVKEMLPFLDQEYDFWQENRSVFLESFGYEANRYTTFTNQPRLVHTLCFLAHTNMCCLLKANGVFPSYVLMFCIV